MELVVQGVFELTHLELKPLDTFLLVPESLCVCVCVRVCVCVHA